MTPLTRSQRASTARTPGRRIDQHPWIHHSLGVEDLAGTREGAAGAHAKIGWSHLTRDVLATVSAHDCAFLLWGNHAQSFRADIRGGGHLIIETAHPSPLSARRGFFGSRPFSRINAWFQTRGEAPIDWVGAP